MGQGAQVDHLDFHKAPGLWYKFVQVQRRFTSTETTRTMIRDGEPRTATSTFTAQLLGSGLWALEVKVTDKLISKAKHIKDSKERLLIVIQTQKTTTLKQQLNG